MGQSAEANLFKRIDVCECKWRWLMNVSIITYEIIANLRITDKGAFTYDVRFFLYFTPCPHPPSCQNKSVLKKH